MLLNNMQIQFKCVYLLYLFPGDIYYLLVFVKQSTPPFHQQLYKYLMGIAD